MCQALSGAFTWMILFNRTATPWNRHFVVPILQRTKPSLGKMIFHKPTGLGCVGTNILCGSTQMDSVIVLEVRNQKSMSEKKKRKKEIHLSRVKSKGRQGWSLLEPLGENLFLYLFQDGCCPHSLAHGSCITSSFLSLHHMAFSSPLSNSFLLPSYEDICDHI